MRRTHAWRWGAVAKGVAPLSLRSVAADASLLLLVGGLAMLGLILALTFLQGLWPERKGRGQERPGSGPQPARHRARQLRPLRETTPLFAERDRAARAGPFRREEYHLPVDLALARVVELQLGEPRLLRAGGRALRVRLYRCRGCALETRGDAAGCGFERDGLQKAFRLRVDPRATAREVRCRIRGAPACEFEVRH